MSLAKQIAFAIAVLIFIALASGIVAYKLIDDKVIENNALAALQNTLKRDVSVTGEFTLTRSLNPTLRTTGISIASADWDKNNYLLQAETLEVGIALLDLLKGTITIQDILFQDAVINIKRNAQGQSNLDFSDKSSDNKKESGAGPTAIDVIDVEVKNLAINYSDEQSKTVFSYVLEDLTLKPINKDNINLNITSQFEQQPISLESDMCRIRYLLRGEDCNITAKLKIDPFDSDIDGSVNITNQGKLDLKLSSKADNINNLILIKNIALPDTDNISIKSNITGNFQEIQLSDLISSIELDSTQLTANGSVDSINTLQGIKLSVSANGEQPTWLDDYQEFLASKHIKAFSIKSSLNGDVTALQANNIDANLTIDDSQINARGQVTITPELLFALDIDAEGKHPAWLNELQQAIDAEKLDTFSLQAQVESKDDVLTIEDIQSNIKINDSNIQARGTINLVDNESVNVALDISSSGSNIQDFEPVLKQSLPKSNRFSLETGFKFNNDLIILDQLSIQIDETELQGSSEIELTSPPNIRAQISANTLNIEHLLATLTGEESTEKTNEKSEDATLFSDEPIELDWLNNAATDISLSIENLIYKDATLNAIKASVTAKDNQAKLDLKSLKYDQANLTADFHVNANNSSYSHSIFTEAFDIGKLLKETEIADTMQGKVDASIDIKSSGKTSRQLATNASGTVTTLMTEGSLADAPIDLLASNLLVELMPGKSKKDTTKIECLFVQFTGENGVFKSDAALLNTENIVMTTTGDVDLTSEKLNLLLAPKPKNIELFTLDANIRVSGPIIDPGFSLDKGSVFKKLLKTAATVALGPATLAIPFTNMAGNKTEKCFNEVADTTTKAVEAQQEAERLAKEQAEKEKLEEALKEKSKKATVEPLDIK